jgi:hypothetical protein
MTKPTDRPMIAPVIPDAWLAGRAASGRGGPEIRDFLAFVTVRTNAIFGSRLFPAQKMSFMTSRLFLSVHRTVGI